MKDDIRRRLKCGLAILGAFVATAVIAAPAHAQSDTGVALFSDANFRGIATFTQSSVPDLAAFGDGWAGRISGLRPIGGIAVAAYSDRNYGGRCETFTNQDPWLGDNAIGNDAIRSIKVGYTCFGPVPGPVVVTDVEVASGSTPSVACPVGYTKKLQDLNEGAGGDYVYLCVKWGPRTGQELIRRVEARYDLGRDAARRDCTDDDTTIDDRYPVEGDLNSGTGSSTYIVFCKYTLTQPDPMAGLRDIDFVTSNTDLVCYTPFFCNDHNWEQNITALCKRKLGGDAYGLVQDLNNSVGGKYIYVCLQPTDGDVPITQVDNRSPTLTSVARTPAGPTGWNTSDVQVTWHCAPGGAPLTSPATIVQTISAEGEDQSAVASCTDLSGHTTNDKVTGISIDRTPPHLTVVRRTPQASAAGWYNRDVDVVWDCSDSRSGVDPADRTVTVTATGEGHDRAAIASCRDRAGNTTSDKQVVNIDRTPPTLTATASTGDGQPYAPGTWTRQNVVVTFHCSDALSGTSAVTEPQTINTGGAAQSVSGRCTDKAGNTTVLDFGGVNIDRATPTVGVTPAGPAVPLGGLTFVPQPH